VGIQTVRKSTVVVLSSADGSKAILDSAYQQLSKNGEPSDNMGATDARRKNGSADRAAVSDSADEQPSKTSPSEGTNATRKRKKRTRQAVSGSTSVTLCLAGGKASSGFAALQPSKNGEGRSGRQGRLTGPKSYKRLLAVAPPIRNDDGSAAVASATYTRPKNGSAVSKPGDSFSAAKPKPRGKLKRIGRFTVKQRQKMLKRWYKKRARILKRFQEGAVGKYQGRTNYAIARPRVKGRFVTTKFMDERGIKYENAQKGWRCTTLNDAVFPTADEAVEALDATQAIMNLFT
jgi:hypothetical protein